MKKILILCASIGLLTFAGGCEDETLYPPGQNWFEESGALVDSGKDEDDFVYSVGKYASLALTPEGAAKIAYYDEVEGALKLAEQNKDGWDKSYLDNGEADVGRYASMKLDAEGGMHIAYYDATNKNLLYRAPNGDRSVVDDSIDDRGRDAQMALDGAGRPYFCYHNTTDKTLIYARLKDGQFSVETIDGFPSGDENPDATTDTTKAGVGEFCSIDVDALGRVWISYYDGRVGALRLARIENDEATVVVIDGNSSGSDTGKFTSLVIGERVSPTNPQALIVDVHISYFDASNSDLRYALVSGDSMSASLTLVDDAGFVGTDTSIALNFRGLPRIAYFDGTNLNLKLAAYTGRIWVHDVISSGGYTGLYNSLAFDGKGLGAVATYEGSQGDLMFYHFPDRW